MRRLSRNIFRNKKGFTLIEVMIVLGVLAVLAAYIFPNVAGIFSDVNKGRVEGEMSSVRQLVESYYARHQVWPANSEDHRDDGEWGADLTEELEPSFEGLRETANELAEEYNDDEEIIFSRGSYIISMVVSDVEEAVHIDYEGNIWWGEYEEGNGDNGDNGDNGNDDNGDNDNGDNGEPPWWPPWLPWPPFPPWLWPF